KALDRDRTRRYGAASELALDLRRHLAHEPVHAGPARAPYRLAKFVRRHRAAVAGAGAGAVVLVAFAVGTVVQSLEVRRALARADRERARAERVSRFLVDVFQAADPFEGGGREVTARAVLDRGAQRVSEELAGEPDVQASVMSAVGRVYSQLRVYDSAERLLRDALALRRQLHAGDHAEVAQSLEELAWVLRLRADTAGAGALLEEAVAMRRRLDPPDPRLAHSLFLLGSLRRQEGKPEAAGALLDEALRLHGAPPAGAGAALPDQGARAAILEEMGNLAAARGDYAAAETRFREALAVRRQDRGRDAPLTAAALGRLGRLLSERGDLEAAEPLLREALAMLERHLGPDHEGLAAPLNNLGLTLQNRGDYAGAEPLYRRALGISKRLHGDAHPSVAVNLNNLGLLFHDQGRFAEAERFFIEALAVQRRVLRPDHPDLAFPTTNLARVLHDQGRLAEAESLYREGLALRRRGLAPANPALADSLAWLGKLQAERGRGLEGEAMLREAVALRAAAFTSDDWRTAEARSLLGGCLTVLGRHAEAEPLLVESYPVLERRRGRNYRRTREAGQRVIAL
ncbi:MAG TPA: tetratricopeptide repeat protein, partial [Vicinamibacteria bacterium]